MRFLFYQKSPYHIGRGAVGYTTGRNLRPKTAGVILLYDCLNTPTAISLAVFLTNNYKGIKMKISYLICTMCTGLLISNNCHGIVDITAGTDCCQLCINANPEEYSRFTGSHHPDCIAGTSAGGPIGRTRGCAYSGCYVVDGKETCQNCSFQPYSDCSINENNALVSYTECGDKTYKCIEGYYGSPTGDSSTCTECPAHATCPGDATFTCDQGYSKIGNKCIKCPAHASCDATGAFTCNPGYAKNAKSNATECVLCPENSECGDGTTVFKCKQSYYLSDDGTNCIKCPHPGMNGGASRAGITSCFIYEIDESLTARRWYDVTGYFNVTGHCYYSTTQTPKYPVLGAGTPGK